MIAYATKSFCEWLYSYFPLKLVYDKVHPQSWQHNIFLKLRVCECYKIALCYARTINLCSRSGRTSIPSWHIEQYKHNEVTFQSNSIALSWVLLLHDQIFIVRSCATVTICCPSAYTTHTRSIRCWTHWHLCRNFTRTSQMRKKKETTQQADH